jgi:aryl-alcohol dehydrogenase-like predicted oxidoreductase
MGIAPWNVLAGGKLRTDAEEEERQQTGENGRISYGGDWVRNENEVKMSRALEKIAKEVGAKSIRAVAIAYVMQKVPHVFPIIGGRKVEHMLSNIEALEIALEPEQIAEIEAVFPFDVGFPHNFIVSLPFILVQFEQLSNSYYLSKRATERATICSTTPLPSLTRGL